MESDALAAEAAHYVDKMDRETAERIVAECRKLLDPENPLTVVAFRDCVSKAILEAVRGVGET